MNNKRIAIIGGGTNSYISNHLALSAPAYGATAKELHMLYATTPDLKMDIDLYLTKMASYGQSNLDTPEDIEKLVDELIADESVRVIIFNCAIVDYYPVMAYGKENRTISAKMTYKADSPKDFGKYVRRISTSEVKSLTMVMQPSEKIIDKIRRERKDIFLVAFKTTCGATHEEQFDKGIKLLKKASANIVFVNDTDPNLRYKSNGIITPEESSYWFENRRQALEALVQMSIQRSHLAFTRSTVIESETVSWDANIVPQTLREVVDYCIQQTAYKPIEGKTVGHFACKLESNVFLTSIRKTNFNDLSKIGLVKVVTDNEDHVYAYGARPSVGGQSQRIIFDMYPELDSIVHFHCPLKAEYQKSFSIKSQFGVECGSHECGNNTAQGLVPYALDDNTVVYAVHLDHHGPNIVFNSKCDSSALIRFIDKHWDLSKKTTGLADDLV